MNWTPLAPLAKEHDLSVGNAAKVIDLPHLALQLPKRTIDARSFMNVNDMLKHYALSKGKLVTTEEGVEKLKASICR